MHIAYIISAYKYPEQLTRLVHRLNTPTSVFLIHVDKRTDKTQYKRMTSGVNCLRNVVFLKRHNCHWGDFGHVRATLKGLAHLIENKIHFDYVFLLTGQDYPIKSNRYIRSFLAKENGKEFISYYSFPNPIWSEDVLLRRIEQWHFRFLSDWPLGKFLDPFVHLPSNKQFKSGLKSATFRCVNIMFKKRGFPKNITPFGGPGYWCITSECANFVHHFVNNNLEFVKFFKYVDVPDEIFFHTIILNSYFSRRVVNDDLRCIDISARKGPRIWRKEDIEFLTKSNALIARKFDPFVDTEILRLIDAKLL